MAAERKDVRSGAAPQPGTAPGDEAAPGTPGAGENICPACKGSGRVQGRPCPNCGGPLKPPRKNAKNPVAVCAACEQRVALDDNDPPRVQPFEWVPRVEEPTSP